MKSLKLRLLAGAAAGLAVALPLAGFALVAIFDHHIRQRYEAELDDHLLQLVAMLQKDQAGELDLRQELSEPEFRRPLSGHYWQVERDGEVVLRSRSLWDGRLSLPGAGPGAGEARTAQTDGPLGQSLIVVERTVSLPTDPALPLRIAVAGDTQPLAQARAAFGGMVGLSLAILGTFLVLATWFQVGAGLAPLDTLRRRLERVRSGAQQRLDGDNPVEVQGLVTDLNRLIETQQRETERARANAAQLGHGLKTPLAVLAAEARTLRQRGEEEAAVSIETEVTRMNAQLARTLAAARAVGPRAALGTQTPIVPVIERLIATLKRLPRGGDLAWTLNMPASPPSAAIDPRDLDDLIGNLLDNARKWACQHVIVGVGRDGDAILLTVDDDGPGIAPEHLDAVLAQGTRLDRSVPGTGIGLSIVKDLVDLHQGRMELAKSPTGGLSARIWLPEAEAAAREPTPTH